MIDEAVAGLGGLLGTVLNVGIGVGALGLDGVDLKEWNDTFAVNLTGADAVLPESAQAFGLRIFDVS